MTDEARPDAATAWLMDVMLRAQDAFRHEPPVTRGRFKGLDCRHDAAIVDPDARRVKCTRCGVQLDPITVLTRMAVQGGDSFVTTRKKLDALNKSYETLLHREKLVKDRLKRAGAKAGISIALGDVESALRRVAVEHNALSETQEELAWREGFKACWHALADLRRKRL